MANIIMDCTESKIDVPDLAECYAKWQRFFIEGKMYASVDPKHENCPEPLLCLGPSKKHPGIFIEFLDASGQICYIKIVTDRPPTIRWKRLL